MVEIFSWEGLVVMRLQSSAQSSVTLFFAVQMCKGLFFLCDHTHLMGWSHLFGFYFPFHLLALVRSSSRRGGEGVKGESSF